MKDKFDIDALRVKPGATIKVKKQAAPKPNETNRPFVMFPVEWMKKIGNSPSRSGAVALVAAELLHEHWRNGGQPVKLANERLSRWGISRFAKTRALHELERIGLVKVDRRDRKSPIVTVHGAHPTVRRWTHS